MIKAIIFDCFGVIYPDTLALVEREFLKPNQADKKLEIRQVRRQCDVGLIDRDAFWDETARIFNVSRKKLDQALDEVRGADWELLEYIRDLKQKFKTAMLSNVGTGFVERMFDNKRPIENYFDAVVLSGEVGILKPDEKIYQLTADKLSVELTECIMVDDKEEYCKVTESLGMPSIYYRDFDQFKTELEQILSR